MSTRIAVLAGMLTFLIAIQLGEILTARQRRLKQRLYLTAIQVPTVEAPGAGPNPVMNARRKKLRLPSIPALGSFIGKNYMDRIKTGLAKAGIPLRPEELAGMSVLLAIAGGSLGLGLGRGVVLAVLLGGAGLLAPGMWVNHAKKQRSSRLEMELVDALTMIANSLRSGHSFMQAIELVGRDAPPPLGHELARVLRESRLGVSIDDAFAGLLSRFESKDLELTVTGVLIQRQVGGNLAQVLDSIAETVEKRIKARGKVRTLTAQGRVSAWVISILPFAMAAIMFSLYPDFAGIMLSSSLGRGLLIAGGVSLTVGVFVVRKVVSVDV